MRNKTKNTIIGIGVASILAGIYTGYRSGEFFDALSGVVIGVSLIGVVLIENNASN